MTTRPPSRGNAGRKGSGAGKGRPPGSGGKPYRPGKPGTFRRPDREGTGPRTSALDAAHRAAQLRGEADKRAPWRPGDAPETPSDDEIPVARAPRTRAPSQ